jgi:hypothetical protein
VVAVSLVNIALATCMVRNAHLLFRYSVCSEQSLAFGFWSEKVLGEL